MTCCACTVKIQVHIDLYKSKLIVLFILSMMISFLQRGLATSVVPAGFREEPCSLNLSLLELLAYSHRIQQCSQAWYRNMFRHTVLLSQSKNMDVLTPLQSIKYTMTHSFFSRAAQGDRVGCCFL
jgi:hypothetical protein